MITTIPKPLIQAGPLSYLPPTPRRCRLGLDQHQVRTWTAFHHHVALCLFAQAFAATRRAHQQRLAANRRVIADLTSAGPAEGAHRENDLTPTCHRANVENLSPGGES